MTSIHPADSSVQSKAEAHIIEALASALGVPLLQKSGKLQVGDGAWVEVDARSEDGGVFVEAFARQGPLKGGQRKKVGQDVLKLALLKRRPEYAEARTIIAFASQEARASVTGWLQSAADVFGVELPVVSIAEELRQEILRAQARQGMTNVKLTEADVADDLVREEDNP